jgi:hypothetical protein
LARPEDFDSYEVLGEHYAAVRRWAPAVLATFSFQSVPAAASLLGAIEMLRKMNEAASLKLPKSVPTGFIRERWARYVMSGGALDRCYYEPCVLSELCGWFARGRRLGRRQPPRCHIGQRLPLAGGAAPPLPFKLDLKNSRMAVAPWVCGQRRAFPRFPSGKRGKRSRSAESRLSTYPPARARRRRRGISGTVMNRWASELRCQI